MNRHRLFECFLERSEEKCIGKLVLLIHIFFCLEIEDSTRSNHASATKGDDRKAGKTYSG